MQLTGNENMRSFLPILLVVLLGAFACGESGGNATMGADPDASDGGDDTGGVGDMGGGSDVAVDSPDGAGMDAAGGECELPDVADGPGLVATDRGYVMGTRDDEVWTWKDIPFAAPPVGDLRFWPPQQAACWDGVRDAAAFGPICPQVEVGQGSLREIGDEDCLTLNIWSPVDGDDGTRRPVLFFIHGGANILGSASAEVFTIPIYRGSHLAERGDAVVVTIQYRLGPLGFLTLPELDAESHTGTSGNYAHMDQIAALEWVQRNIEAFGGDPDRVMVFGESAGAVNTCVMVASPLAEGLLHGALMLGAF
jgi:para-nitrobenzyl esterase